MSAQARAVRDHRGDVTGAIIGMRDVHDRVEARLALAATQHHYRILAENATDAVYLVDQTGVVLWASPAFERLLGLAPALIVGTRVAEGVHPESLPVLRSVQNRHPARGDGRACRAAGPLGLRCLSLDVLRVRARPR